MGIRRSLWLLLLPQILLGCAHGSDCSEDRFIDVGGHRLHLRLVGRSNQHPAVILESGAGGGVGWENTRNQIAKFAQVITYDRAGTGQSEPGPEPRDARTIARELHAALHEAGVAPPYILVGQSLGGLYVQVFAANYPDETAGLVLVDPTYASSEICVSLDDVKTWFMNHHPADWPRVEALCQGAPEGFAGFLAYKYQVMEMFIETIPEPRRSSIRSEWWGMIDTLVGHDPPKQFADGWLQEATVMMDSIRQAVAARPLPRVPIILLSAGKMDLDTLPSSEATPNVSALQAHAREWKMSVYQDWVNQTAGAKLVVVPGSGHDIESQSPQAVIDAVRNVAR